MKRRSIITKIVALTCGIVAVLVLLGGFVLIRYQINMVDRFTDETLKRIHQFIDNREIEETKSLLEDIKFNAEILSAVGARYLYNLDQDGLKEVLRPYMNYQEIVAIQVVDETGKPFAAAWRSPDVAVGTTLPDALTLDDKQSVKVTCTYDNKPMGKFQVYYTDEPLKKKIRALKASASEKAAAFEHTSRSELNRAILTEGTGIIIILLVLVVSLALLLRAMVARPIKTVSGVARQLSAFDLTVQVKSNREDEIGDLLNAMDEMAHSFRQVVGQVQRSGIQVTSSATELAATAKEQETTMANQVDSTSKMVQSVDSISEVATRLMETMEEVASMSQETAGFATSGQTDLKRMEAAMHNMEGASKSISGRLETINEKAENITNVVDTITKVADQTNLLSLNAAIEAEKAGEYGRGFNVVAREIRRLADQTAVATLDIERMVEEMQSAVSAGVMEMDKFIGEVKHSAEDVEKISAQLGNIIEQVQTLSPSFENVNVSMRDQSASAQKINSSMARLNEEMQETMESLHETYSAIEQLKEAARGLQNEVSRFKVD
ncbi:MAG: methyl-accepting chemotaxis protein [Deltaproteobacteria bacterium]|nr:methyl-accepting chemotaxis protein [Deltaproteobacteria bacterium]